MFGILQQFEYGAYLQEQKTKHKTAIKLGKKSCQKCGHCCMIRPCIPTPEEFHTIAKYLKMSPRDTLKKYFVIDALDEGNTKFIFPAKTTQRDITGRYIPANRTFDKGYCIFFVKGKGCKIHKVKPAHAKASCCWKPANEEASTTKVIKKWESFDFSALDISNSDLNNDDYDDVW